MAHSHSHTNDHHDLNGRNLLISIFLNVVITAAQAIGGFLSGSLSLLSDALHNFSDVLSLVISYIADLYAKKEASFSKTFGYKRAEIIAAFVNAASLIIVAIFLIFEAIERFQNPQEVESNLVIWLALLGILANGLSVLLLRKSANENMNMRSAYLHLITDMSASVAVLIGGIVMKYLGWFWVDPLLTVCIAVYLVVMGWALLKSSFKVLMLFTPEDVNVAQLKDAVCQFQEIETIHHIHIWQLNEKEIHLEAHIDLMEDIRLSEFDVLLDKLEVLLYRDFGINHVNIQPEFRKDDPKDAIVQD